jgi:hypothetical protein
MVQSRLQAALHRVIIFRRSRLALQDDAPQEGAVIPDTIQPVLAGIVTTKRGPKRFAI